MRSRGERMGRHMTVFAEDQDHKSADRAAVRATGASTEIIIQRQNRVVSSDDWLCLCLPPTI